MDKIPYYEPAYPEETHYSHICRLAKLNGIDSMNMFSNQYLRFGSENKETIIRNSTGNFAPFFMSADIPMDYADYILATTAYSYHSMFMNEYRQIKTVNRLFQIDNRYNYNVHDDKKIPCFCKECMKEKVYYRRLHQIPNVNYCPIHNKPLFEYIGTIGHELTDYETANREVKPILSEEKEIQIANFVQGILDKSLDISAIEIRNIVKSKIEEVGGKDVFAKDFHLSEFSVSFADEKSICNFVNTGFHKNKLREDKVLAILVYLFQNVDNFLNYYDSNKNKYYTNKVDEDEFYEFIKNEGYTLISKFRQDIIVLMHNDCNKCFLTTPQAILNGWICPFCSRYISEEDFQSRIVNYTEGNDYSLVKIAFNTDKRITLHHSKCDRDITPIYEDLLFRGYTCDCENRISKTEASRRVSTLGNFELLSFSRISEPATIRCNDCGGIIKYSKFSSVSDRIRCKTCNPTPPKKERNGEHKKYNKHDNESIIQNIKSLVGSEYEILDIIRNNSGHKDIVLRHNSCGNELTISYQNFAKGSRCVCEGFYIQATTDEIKRYIFELSGGRYICIDKDNIDRNNINIQDTISGNILSMSYKLIIQELKRPTLSTVLPCDTKQTNVKIPRSAPMLFMEYLKDTFGRDGVFFKRDIDYDATDNWIASSLNMFLSQGLLNRIASETYTFPDIIPDWNEIIKLFYIKQNNVRHGCTYGRSFLEELGIPMKCLPRKLHIISNRDVRATSAKNVRDLSVRKMGPLRLNVKAVPCKITEENYKILQVADYMGGYNNQNYPSLNQDELQIMADYIADVPKSVINTTLSYFSKDVKQKVLNLVNS